MTDLKLFSRDDTIPVGAAVKTVNDDVNVYLMIKGFVDFEQEIEKLQKKLEKSEENLKSWKKKTEIPDYMTKVSADIREQNDAKVRLFYI